PWIVDRDFVFQRAEIGSSEALNQVKLLGMGQPAVGNPELFVKCLRVDNQCVSLPAASGVAIVQRVVRIAASVAGLRAAMRINEVPDVVPAALSYKNSSEVFVLVKLNSVRHLKLTYCARRFAVKV